MVSFLIYLVSSLVIFIYLIFFSSSIYLYSCCLCVAVRTGFPLLLCINVLLSFFYVAAQRVLLSGTLPLLLFIPLIYILAWFSKKIKAIQGCFYISDWFLVNFLLIFEQLKGYFIIVIQEWIELSSDWISDNCSFVWFP